MNRLLLLVLGATPIIQALPGKVLEKRAASQTYMSTSPPVWYSNSQPFLVLDNNVGFYLQGDGNFVVYNGAPVESNALWNSGTPGHSCGASGSCWIQFQGDGNLVAYSQGNPPSAYWSSGTNTFTGHPDPAYSMILSNTAPYVALYDKSGKAMGYSYSSNSFIVVSESGGSGPPPCERSMGGGERRCVNPPIQG